MKGITVMRWSRREVPATQRVKAGAVFTGLIRALSASVAACVLMFSWVVLTAGPVYDFSAFMVASSVIGAVLGGFASARAAGSLGLLHGFLAGMLYGLLVIALFVAGGTGAHTIPGLALRGVAFGMAGAAGGVFGVNAKFAAKKRAGGGL